MCTLTWSAAVEGGYDLFFNRDERTSRAAEIPPVAGRTETGVEYLAPADGDHGGTWLLLNTHGLTVCLLNYYPRGIVETGRESRGRLPLACASCMRSEDVPQALRYLVLTNYAPFHLVAVDGAGSGIQLSWDGQELHEMAAPGFLTSSSFESVKIQARRAEVYARRTPAQSGERFHWAHDPSDGAGSVLMCRPDAATRSVCAIRVRSGEASLAYSPVRWADGQLVTPERQLIVLSRA
ncbi:MAG: NRDE family protein [Opitutaceae bacterium]|jgi:hypothetical protein